MLRQRWHARSWRCELGPLLHVSDVGASLGILFHGANVVVVLQALKLYLSEEIVNCQRRVRIEVEAPGEREFAVVLLARVLTEEEVGIASEPPRPSCDGLILRKAPEEVKRLWLPEE